MLTKGYRDFYLLILFWIHFGIYTFFKITLAPFNINNWNIAVKFGKNVLKECLTGEL